jgi:DNA polymerase-3 subunit alpha
MGSAPTFYQACREKGINPILGCELYVVPEYIMGERGKDVPRASHLTVLALSKEGYFNLVAWTTHSSDRENFYHSPRISVERMVEIAPFPLHHNVILTGCLGGELAKALSGGNGNALTMGVAYVRGLRAVFPNVFVEMQNHHRPKYIGRGFENYEQMVRSERSVRHKLIDIARATRTPVVVTNDSHFQRPAQRESHLIMTAQKLGKGRVTIEDYYPSYGYLTSYMQSMERIADALEPGIQDEAIQNAIAIGQEARIRLPPLDDFTYSIPFSGYRDPVERIRRRCKVRLDRCVGLHGDVGQDRFDSELEAMGDFAHYLLLMSDFIRFARKQGILTNTRGSAANSLLCYCLGIHDIDSIEYGLTFERFYNPMRKKLPDIDIDIEADRYEDFMVFVKSHMDELEGDGQVVPIGTYGTLANRSAFRKIADQLGVPKEIQDEVSRILPQMIDSGMVEEEADAYELLRHEYPELYDLTAGVFDALRNISQHACGWLFGTQDRPIEKWVPLVLIASSGVRVTAYNLASLDSIGLVKGDFLRLKTLSVVKRTLKAIGKDALDLQQIPLDDPETFQMLREGRTEGVFTLQGKENRRGVMDVEAESVHDVIRSVAIYRPALTRPGYDKVFNRRRRGEEEVEYPHPLFAEILGPTYGLPIFQEQIMDVGYAIGMDHLEVEEFLQAIKKAKGVGRGAKEAFEKLRPMFLRHAREAGLDKRERIGGWQLTTSFQGYGFNKGHATSYGLLAVRSAYLKCHHRPEFFESLLDVYPNKGRYIAAARFEGFEFANPCVNESRGGFSLDRRSGSLRVGLSRITGLGPVAVREILEGQPFSSYDDFKERTTSRAVNSARTETLARLGALESLGVKGERDDTFEFNTLGFTIRRPRALRGWKPRHVGNRSSASGWVHRGLERTVEFTAARSSVSKRFWIPPERDMGRKGSRLKLKASAWAQQKSWLLDAVDENGVAFSIIVPEEKTIDAQILEFLYKRSIRNGISVSLDGAIRQPFLQDGPLGFRMYGITGSFQRDPQIREHPKLEKVKAALNAYNDLKRRTNA